MGSISEVVSNVLLKELPSRTNPDPRLPELNPVPKLERGILLVGRNSLWSLPLFRLIEKCGAEPVFVSPVCATSEYVKECSTALVLLGPSAPPEYRKRLASDLLGSKVSLFYAYPVEIGSWWLPALHYGEDCHGSPALRANEFPVLLRRILQDWFVGTGSVSLYCANNQRASIFEISLDRHTPDDRRELKVVNESPEGGAWNDMVHEL